MAYNTDSIGGGAAEDDVYGVGWNGDSDAPSKNAVYDKIELMLTGVGMPYHETFALGDQDTDITTGQKLSTTAPFAFTLTQVIFALRVAGTGATPTLDVNKNGTTVLSTKATIDISEVSSITAAVPPVISVASFAKGDVITFDIDVIGSTIAGKGPEAILLGTRTAA